MLPSTRSSLPPRLAALAAVALLAGAAGATQITVDSTADDFGQAPNGNCTLREALIAANTNLPVDGCLAGQAGPGVVDRIVLAAGTYTLTVGPAGDGDAQSGDLDVNDEVEIEGAGARTTVIDAGSLDRVFEIAADVAAGFTDVEVTGGDSTGNGGGFLNFGELSLTRCTVSNNRTDAAGGGIRNEGMLIVDDSTLVGNQAPADHGGGLDDHGTSILTNTTVSGNSTLIGGGLYNLGGTSMTLVNVTVTGNIAPTSGSALVNQGSTMVINTLIHGGCSAPVASSGGGNLESPGNTCGLGAGDQAAIPDPELGPLANNGGSTDTHALLSGSAAIDRAAGACPAADQRGVARPVDGDGDSVAQCDVGAYEAEPGATIFADGFESGDFGAWSSSVP